MTTDEQFASLWFAEITRSQKSTPNIRRSPMAQPRAYPSQDRIIPAALDGEVICNIGQIAPETELKLNKLVRIGGLAKWRGYWFPTAGAPWGIGPLKTCWGLPAIRNFYERRSA